MSIFFSSSLVAEERLIKMVSVSKNHKQLENLKVVCKDTGWDCIILKIVVGGFFKYISNMQDMRQRNLHSDLLEG